MSNSVTPCAAPCSPGIPFARIADAFFAGTATSRRATKHGSNVNFNSAIQKMTTGASGEICLRREERSHTNMRYHYYRTHLWSCQAISGLRALKEKACQFSNDHTNHKAGRVVGLMVLQLHTAEQPHVVYGGDHLYYASNG